MNVSELMGEQQEEELETQEDKEHVKLYGDLEESEITQMIKWLSRVKQGALSIASFKRMQGTEFREEFVRLAESIKMVEEAEPEQSPA